jgi:hypothetical protein
MEPKSFSDEIRNAVRRSGRTNNSIAAAMGIAPSVLHRFMRGSGLTTVTLDRLAKVLDLHVTVEQKKKEK